MLLPRTFKEKTPSKKDRGITSPNQIPLKTEQNIDMRKPIETWEQLQDKASSLIYTKGRLKQELADLKRYKHHLTGRSLDDQHKPRREEKLDREY